MLTHTPAVRLEAVSKRFRLYGSPLRQMLGYLGLSMRDVRQKLALDSVSLTIGHGERVGVVGHNGSGKTTLLRLIIGHTRATSGRVRVDGKVQALMQTGYGFTDELTGLENIRNALVYNGLTARDVPDAEADIVEFVELGEFLQYPLKTYSLGMRARLEFATATAIRPEVLAIDEVLGAGDGYFVHKCAQRMRELVTNTTLLLVSHSLDQIREYCSRVVWLEAGCLREDGPVETVLDRYRQHMSDQTARLRSAVQAAVPAGLPGGHRVGLLVKARALFAVANEPDSSIVTFGFDGTQDAIRVMETGDPLALRLSVQLDRPLRPVVLGLSEHGAFVFELEAGPALSPGRHDLLLGHPRLGVGVGHYVLVPALREADGGRVAVMGEALLELQMAAANWSDPPLVHLDAQWTSGRDRTPIDSKVSAWV